MSTDFEAHMDAEDEEAGGEMTLLEHLAELRRRVVYSFIAVAVGFGVSWTWVEDLFTFILVPLEAAAPEAGMGQINYKDLTEPFFTLIKTAIIAGVFLAIPVILYQIWKFVAPGLYKHERRLALPFVAIASAFFFVGASFCYYFVMPYGFEFLFKFSQGVDANPTLMMSEHYNLAIKLLLAFGIVFEMPVAAMFLSAVGVITHRTLIEYWRISVVVAFIFAAMLTPPDIGTQLAMAIPLIVLYGISIGVAYVFTTRRERRDEAIMDELG
ncbi:MAG: twin-arginine translocase subunit TatC [Myxococcota bacterium]